MGDVIADAQLEATKPSDFGGSRRRVHEPGRDPGQPPLHAHGRPADSPSRTASSSRCSPSRTRSWSRPAPARRSTPCSSSSSPANRILQISNSLRYSYSAERCRRQQGRSGDDQDRRHDRQPGLLVPRDDEQLPRRRRRRLQRLHAVHEPARRRGRPRRPGSLLHGAFADRAAAAEPHHAASVDGPSGGGGRARPPPPLSVASGRVLAPLPGRRARRGAARARADPLRRLVRPARRRRRHGRRRRPSRCRRRHSPARRSSPPPRSSTLFWSYSRFSGVPRDPAQRRRDRHQHSAGQPARRCSLPPGSAGRSSG